MGRARGLILNLTEWAAIASDPRIYRGLEVVHLVGLSSLFGGLLLLELRLLGLQPSLDAQALTRLAVPVALMGFALCLLSGAAMFASQPEELWVNGAFRLKMLLILLAGANALGFHFRGGASRTDRVARLQALASLLLWLVVMVCGRWIAVV